MTPFATSLLLELGQSHCVPLASLQGLTHTLEKISFTTPLLELSFHFVTMM